MAEVYSVKLAETGDLKAFTEAAIEAGAHVWKRPSSVGASAGIRWDITVEVVSREADGFEGAMRKQGFGLRGPKVQNYLVQSF